MLEFWIANAESTTTTGVCEWDEGRARKRESWPVRRGDGLESESSDGSREARSREAGESQQNGVCNVVIVACVASNAHGEASLAGAPGFTSVAA